MSLKAGSSEKRSLFKEDAAKDENLPAIEVRYEDKDRLYEILEEYKTEEVKFNIPDVAEMLAELRGVSRSEILQDAVSTWFHHALGHPVLEVETSEQTSEESAGRLLVFRIKLKADMDAEVAQLNAGEELPKVYRDKMIETLPADLAGGKLNGHDMTDRAALKSMVDIYWTKAGSIELGGVASLGLVILAVMAIQAEACHWDEWCPCGEYCPCISRVGHTDRKPSDSALWDLHQRGAQFHVRPDGGATVRFPPSRQEKWRCPDCFLL